MILEYSQLLSTAHRVLDGTMTTGINNNGRKQTSYVLADSRDNILYRATHLNHPSSIWVRQSTENYMWLAELLVQLCNEYTYRYGKVHKCEQSGLVNILATTIPNNIPHHSFTQPTPAMPTDCILHNDSMLSYRNYYIIKKKHIASWCGKINSRQVPDWYNYE